VADGKASLKRLIEVFGSLVFYAGHWIWSYCCQLFGRKLPPRCVVLYYHAISDRECEHFVHQMEEAIRRANPIPCGTQSIPKAGSRYFAVTFDDGYDCTIRNALPELQKRNIPCTIFVVTDGLGRSPQWDSYCSSNLHMREPLLSEQVLETLPSDLVAIGSHTKTHPMLTRLSEVEARRELLESRGKLERLLHRQVRLLSFPYGDFDEQIIKWSREAGYQRVFTILPKMALTRSDEFVTGRVSVEPTDWQLEFRLKLFGAYRWLPWAFALKRWILGRRARPVRQNAQFHEANL
jgi:peptidoglycan/xylan/chitin deacetylase (PgdA/CDA1 family)